MSLQPQNTSIIISRIFTSTNSQLQAIVNVNENLEAYVRYIRVFDNQPVRTDSPEFTEVVNMAREWTKENFYLLWSY